MNFKSLILAASFFVASHNLHAETWDVASLEWQPYSASYLEGQGQSIVKLRTALEEAGIGLNVSFLPWKRAIKSSEKGKFVGYYPAWPQEVVDGFIASEPVDFSTLAVIYREGDVVDYVSLDQLFSQYKVGYVETYVYAEEIQKQIMLNPANAISAPDEISLLKKLKNKRSDVVLTDPDIMAYLAKKEGIEGLVASSNIITKKPLVMAVKDTPENRKNLDALNAVLAK